MSRILDHVRFCGELIAACGHMIREAYYGYALRHIRPDHDDLWIITRRYEQSRQRVNDFLRKVT